MTTKRLKYYFSAMNVQIALSFFLFSILLMAFLSFAYYQFSYQTMLSQAEAQTDAAVEQSAHYIETYLGNVRTLSNVLATRPDIIAALAERTAMTDKDLISIIDIIKASDPFIHSIAIVSAEGQVATSDSEMFEDVTVDYMMSDWYQAAMSGQQMPALTSIRRGQFSMNQDQWVISLAREIVSPSGEHLGILLIDISYDFIERYLSGLELGANGYSFVITNSGQIVYHEDVSVFDDQAKIDRLVAICELDSGYRNEMNLVTFKSGVEHSNWILVGLSSLDEIAAFQSKMMRTIGMISAGIALLSLAVAVVLSQRISRPVRQLESALQTTGDSWQHLAVSNRSSAEIKSLTEQYNAMIDRICELIDNLKSVEEERRVDSIKTLQSQINPHFLYNTLDTIVWLSEFEDHQAVIAVTKSLGRMLRMGLNLEQPLISLADELTYLEHYLLIQGYRYGERFSYQIKGDEQLLGCQIPKLILQPIVENAIYHGINPADEPGQIAISYQRCDGDLIIVIGDNGIGYDATKPKAERPKLGGIGLDNVKRRIQLLYGESYGLTVDSQPGRGTTVRYRLPLAMRGEVAQLVQR